MSPIRRHVASWRRRDKLKPYRLGGGMDEEAQRGETDLGEVGLGNSGTEEDIILSGAAHG